MFKKDKNKKEAKEYKVDSKTWDSIHVMPSQFYSPPKRNSAKLIILIAGVILILVSIIILAVFLNANLRTTNQEINNTNNNINTNVNANTNVNTNVNTNTNTNTNTNVNTNVNTNTNTNINTNINTNTSPIQPGQLPLGADRDSDQLSTLEEEMFGSQANNKDSDNDGYQDGMEVLAGFSPKDAGLTLLEAKLVNQYSKNEYNYQLVYPSSWIWTEVDANKQVVFNSRTGSFIEVRILENTANLDLSEFYLRQVAGALKNELTNVPFNDFIGIYDQLRLTYYLALKNNLNQVYALVYRPGTKATLDYLTTFAMMVKSLRVQ